MCRKRSEAQGTGRGSEKGARDAGKYLQYFGCWSEAGNNEQYRRNYFIDPGWDGQRMMETKILQKGGKQESGREGEHEGQEMWEVFKNK